MKSSIQMQGNLRVMLQIQNQFRIPTICLTWGLPCKEFCNQKPIEPNVTMKSAYYTVVC